MSAPTRAPAPGGGLRWAIADSLVIAQRHLRHIPRIPEMFFFTMLQPIMFILLFAYVFGGAIQVQGGDAGVYREFLMGGIFAQTVAFGGAATGVGLADDMQKGLIDRFRSLPMTTSAVLVGRTFADVVRNGATMTVMMIVALVVGWRVHDGLVRAAAAVVLLLLFAYAMGWIGTLIGLSVRNVETANTAGFVWLFPVTFISNAFVDPSTMPGWMQTFADWNPISATVAAARQLFGNVDPRAATSDAFPMEHPVITSLFWSLVIVAVFAPLSMRKYRRAASR